METFRAFLTKHNICNPEDTVGIICGIRNDLIPGDCWFPHEAIVELVHPPGEVKCEDLHLSYFPL